MVQASAQTTTRPATKEPESVTTSTSSPRSTSSSTREEPRRSAAGLDRQLLHQGGAAAGGHDGAALLEQPDGAGRQRELRPAPDDLGVIEQLVGDADVIERRRVVDHRDRGRRREQVEAADDRDQLLAGPSFELRPVVVGLLGQPHVAGRVVAVPQDPAGVVARAAVVPELEPLEPEHPTTSSGEMHRRGAAEGAEAHHDDVVGVSHPRASAAATAGCRRCRPPSARTTRACRPATTSRVARTRRSPSPAC